MTERGLPIVDGAPACPFVAFEDERDERATSPDHRHRCYAEARPAPRALAHQEAYCLSSAFPVCPTFQDWARREAARTRAEAEPAAVEDDDESPARNPARGWAAPPPWLDDADSEGRGYRAAGPSDLEDDIDEASLAAGSALGLSGGFADRLIGGQPPRAADGAPADVEDDAGPDDNLDEGSDAAPDRSVGVPLGRRHRERDDDRSHAEGGRNGRPRRERPDDRRRGSAPDWERPRRMEAYPTLRSRSFTSVAVPPILVGVVAIALAAAILFALPGILGFGGPQAEATPSPSPVATEQPTEGPTQLPQPTAQVYLVQSGDTLSRIANKFHVPLADLIAANKDTIPNPDVLQVGQEVIIPIAQPTAIPGASAEPAAS
jgi:LysM domain